MAVEHVVEDAGVEICAGGGGVAEVGDVQGELRVGFQGSLPGVAGGGDGCGNFFGDAGVGLVEEGLGFGFVLAGPCFEEEGFGTDFVDFGVELFGEGVHLIAVEDGALAVFLEDDVVPVAFADFGQGFAFGPVAFEGLAAFGYFNEFEFAGDFGGGCELLDDGAQAAVEEGVAVADEEDS